MTSMLEIAFELVFFGPMLVVLAVFAVGGLILAAEAISEITHRLLTAAIALRERAQ